MRWLRAVGIAALASAGGCSGGGASPTGAVRAFAEAAQAGDVDAVVARLGPRTRAKLEADAKLVAQAGRRELKARDLLAVGWTPPRFKLSDIREIERHGDVAAVEVVGAHGERERVDLVREPDGWKLELP